MPSSASGVRILRFGVFEADFQSGELRKHLVGLGDRYAGTIEYGDGLLPIGPDEGWFNRGEVASRKTPIR